MVQYLCNQGQPISTPPVVSPQRTQRSGGSRRDGTPIQPLTKRRNERCLRWNCSQRSKTYETIYNYITEEQIVTLPAEVQGGVVPPANTVIDDENVPLVPGENDDQEDGDQDGNQDGDGDLTDIDDEETPLGDGGDETEIETETKIDEVEVPLSWGAMIRANMGWIIGGSVALVLIVSGITVLIIRRKKQLKLKNMSSSQSE